MKEIKLPEGQPCLLFREFEPLKVYTYKLENNMTRIQLEIGLPKSYYEPNEKFKPVFVKSYQTSDIGEDLEAFKGMLISQLYQDIVNWAIHSKFGWKFNFEYNKWERIGEPQYKEV